jgi:exopolysaccharide biosynthesis polyprenyl glycosylphosphotransferase
MGAPVPATRKSVPAPPVHHDRSREVAVLLIDTLAFVGAFALAMHLRFSANLGVFEPGEPPWGAMLNALPVMLGAWLLILRVLGLYQLPVRLFEEVARLAAAIFILLGLLLTLAFFYRGFSYSRGFTLLFMPLVVALTLVGRIGFRIARRRILGSSGMRTRLLLVGHSPIAEHLANASLEKDSPIEVLGVLDDHDAVGTEVARGIKVIGKIDALKTLAKEVGAQGIVITTSKLEESAQLELLEDCLASDLEWSVVPNTYELMLDRVRFEVIEGVPVLGLRRSNIRGLNRWLKRVFDVSVALFVLVVLSPLMAVVAALVKLTSAGPVFYAQDRVGQGGRHFKFYKFRSMRTGSDDKLHREYAKKWIEQGEAAHVDRSGQAVFKLKSDPRITLVGAFIRKYSIDELPQLFNVLRGDMSLIGPRPPIPYEVEVYREWHRRRLEGPQGITGLWQVSGRNRLSFDEMVMLDIEYIENWSLALDLKILWRTVGVVLFGRAH